MHVTGHAYACPAPSTLMANLVRWAKYSRMDPAKQDRWLSEHVPHRIRASLSGLALQDELMPATAGDELRASIRARSLFNAAWEGRIAGIRWLIEFVGVVDRGGKPDRPNRRGADVGITDIAGGVEFDLSVPEALVLSRVWRGCSQASGHPTADSSHPPVDDKALDDAMRTIIGHLDRTIYAKSARKLIDEVMIPMPR